MFKLVLLISVFYITAVKAQVITDSLLIEKHYRTFHYKNPGDNKTSLMFVLHGSGGNGKDMMSSTTRLEEKAKAEQLLVVYPNGYQIIGTNAEKLRLQWQILRTLMTMPF